MVDILILYFAERTKFTFANRLEDFQIADPCIEVPAY